MFNDQKYTTPEGFYLYKPLLFPEVRDFTDLFTVEGEWDFETMNHRNGYPQAATPKNITDPLGEWEKEVGRFCSVRPNGAEGPLGRIKPLFVTPTALITDLVFARPERNEFAFFDRISFEAIYHPSNDRVLIVASASLIIASRWLAYVDPATVPGLAEVVRDG